MNWSLRRLLLLLFFGVPLAGMAQEPHAVVSRYLPASAEHIVQRTDGTRSLIALGNPLFAGDSIDVLSGGSVLLTYADGDTETLAGPTRFVVPERAPMGIIANFLGRLNSVLGREYRQGANLATRGGGSCDDDGNVQELKVPALSATTRLGPGHEDLSLAWIGGCAPYSLSISNGSGRTFTAEQLGRPQARLATPNLAPGEYTLTVRDADGGAFVSRLIVHETLPEGPFASAIDDNELTAVAHAAWLANLENQAWRWESFQLLRPWIRQGSTLAGTYGDLLLWGDPSLSENEQDN